MSTTDSTDVVIMSICAGCGTEMNPGEEAAVNLEDGMFDGWLCATCYGDGEP